MIGAAREIVDHPAMELIGEVKARPASAESDKSSTRAAAKLHRMHALLIVAAISHRSHSASAALY
jgi:hypothetical protein